MRLKFYCDQATFDRFEALLPLGNRFVSTGTICSDPAKETMHPKILLVPINGLPLTEWPILEANEP